MKIDMIKDGHIRSVKPSKLQGYLDSGWRQLDSGLAEEVTATLKPPAKVKAAATAEDNTIEIKGE